VCVRLQVGPVRSQIWAVTNSLDQPECSNPLYIENEIVFPVSVVCSLSDKFFVNSTVKIRISQRLWSEVWIQFLVDLSEDRQRSLGATVFRGVCTRLSSPKETSSNPLRAGGVLDRVNRVFVICKGAGVFDGDGSWGSALVDGSGGE
jgi:hypothetical protein